MLSASPRIDLNGLRTLVLGDWMPFAVVPKTTVTKQFVFESRWDEPVVQELEFIVSGNRESWKMQPGLKAPHYAGSSAFVSEANGAVEASDKPPLIGVFDRVHPKP